MGMWVASMDTEHYSWIAAGDTKEQALLALAEGFLVHLVRATGDDEPAVLERFAASVDREDITREEFGAALDDYYGVALDHIEPGQCLRDHYVINTTRSN